MFHSYVLYLSNARSSLTLPFLVLRLLCGIHGFPRCLKVPVLDSYVHRFVHYLVYRILYVSLTQLPLPNHPHHFSSWDTAMAQKSHFKMQTQGIHTFRKTFPQLPGNTVENPTYIQTAHGNRLLTSGWWAWSRKPVSISPSVSLTLLNISTMSELCR